MLQADRGDGWEGSPRTRQETAAAHLGWDDNRSGEESVDFWIFLEVEAAVFTDELYVGREREDSKMTPRFLAGAHEGTELLVTDTEKACGWSRMWGNQNFRLTMLKRK